MRNMFRLHLCDKPILAFDLGIYLRLMGIVVGKRRVNLGQRKMGMRVLNVLGTIAQRLRFDGNLGDFHARPGDIGDTALVGANVVHWNGNGGHKLSPCSVSSSVCQNLLSLSNPSRLPKRDKRAM